MRGRRLCEHRLRRPTWGDDPGLGGRRRGNIGGVGHRNKGSESGFSVVGAYPPGQQDYDLRTGEEDERPEVLENIRNAALPKSDSLFG